MSSPVVVPRNHRGRYGTRSFKGAKRSQTVGQAPMVGRVVHCLAPECVT